MDIILKFIQTFPLWFQMLLIGILVAGTIVALILLTKKNINIGPLKMNQPRAKAKLKTKRKTRR